jgi:hypothetical protein
MKTAMQVVVLVVWGWFTLYAVWTWDDRHAGWNLLLLAAFVFMANEMWSEWRGDRRRRWAQRMPRGRLVHVHYCWGCKKERICDDVHGEKWRKRYGSYERLCVWCWPDGVNRLEG